MNSGRYYLFACSFIVLIIYAVVSCIRQVIWKGARNLAMSKERWWLVVILSSLLWWIPIHSQHQHTTWCTFILFLEDVFHHHMVDTTPTSMHDTMDTMLPCPWMVSRYIFPWLQDPTSIIFMVDINESQHYINDGYQTVLNGYPPTKIDVNNYFMEGWR